MGNAGGCCASGSGPLGCAGNPDCSTDAADRRRRRPPALRQTPTHQPEPEPEPAGLPAACRTVALGAEPEASLDAWLDLLAEVFAGKTTRGYFEDHWAADPAASRDAQNVFLGLSGSGELVGSVRLYLRRIWVGGRERAVAGVGEVATRATHRGCGVASTLLDSAAQSMRARGIGLSMLHTSSAPGLYHKLGWRAVDATSILLPVTAETRLAESEEGWALERVELTEEQDLHAELGRCYDAVATRFDGPAVRNQEYWRKWVASEGRRRRARCWAIRAPDDGVIAYATLTCSGWGRREGALPAAAPLPELQLVDFGCLDCAAAAVERRLGLLCAEALRTGPGSDGVCVLPAPLLTIAAGKKSRVDRGWFYRFESEHESEQEQGGAPTAQKHVVWTVDKF